MCIRDRDRGAKENGTYAVIKNSTKNGFPGLIIEHAFLSNSSDAKNYLKTESGIKKLGIACLLYTSRCV